MSNKRISQRENSNFLQWATSKTSNEQILQRATSDFTMSNEQRVKSYASWKYISKFVQTFRKENCFYLKIKIEALISYITK